MTMVITTEIFAAVGGEGMCQGVFLVWDYIRDNKSAVSCDSVYDEGICGNYSGNEYNNCQNFVYDIGASGLSIFCENAKYGSSGDGWIDFAVSEGYCQYGYEMPYHLRFASHGAGTDDVLSSAFEDLTYNDNSSIRCYNDDSAYQMFLTVCDCGERMDDLSAWYDQCPESIYESGEVGSTCYLGNDGEQTLLCVPFEEAFNTDGCQICWCEGYNGDVVDDGWTNAGATGSLYSEGVEFIDLMSSRAEDSSWGAYAYGCSTQVSGTWACDSGYYYNSANNCSVCPAHSSGKQTSAYANTDGMTGCYLPAGTYTDDIGTFVYSQDCYYSN